MAKEEAPIVNRVARMGILTIDLEDLYPDGERVLYDIKDDLWQGMALKEKDFREHVASFDWSEYQGKHVAIHCSVDAIVPTWAYMLLATALQPHAATVVFGDLHRLEEKLFDEVFNKMDLEEYRDRRIVIKGCGEKEIPESVYVELTQRLQSLAKAIMYGEPCSTVPVYRQPR